MAGVATAIDDRQTLEAKCEALEDQVIARTEALLAAREEVRSVERMKRNFITLLSHELRTPLTSIVGMSELILDRLFQSEEDMLEMVRTVFDEGMRLHGFVNDAAEFLQLEAGLVPLTDDVVDVRRLIEDIVKALREEYAEKALQVDLVASERVVITADARLLEDLLRRLLDNALKFSKPRGNVSIRIDGTVSPVDGSWVTVAIRDEGEGISPEHATAMYKALTLCHSYNHHSRGWGLGIAIAREIARLHGGTVQLESAGQDQGCRAVVCLPARLAGGSSRGGRTGAAQTEKQRLERKVLVEASGAFSGRGC